MTEQPDQPDTSSTPDVDDVAPVANLFDADAPRGRDRTVEPDPTDAPAPADEPPADEPASHESTPDEPAPDESVLAPDEPAPDESVLADDEADDQVGTDWEQLAALDPRTAGEVLADLHAVTASRDDYLDALQRKQAEFENFRRRMQGQAAGQRVAGHADVAGRVLEVLDDFDRTLASIAATSDDGVVKGVTLVRDKLVAALREVGLERVDDQGERFDPTRHEAVQQVPGDGLVGEDGEPVVAEVLRPGYVLGDRVLRAAMVAVAQ